MRDSMGMYRGKRLHKKEWAYGSLIISEEWAFILPATRDVSVEGNWGYEVDPETVGEFTGIQDLEGEDIYEGDRWQRNNFIGVVEFAFSGWHLLTAWDTQAISYPSFYSNAKTGEVIGNIHDKEEQK